MCFVRNTLVCNCMCYGLLCYCFFINRQAKKDELSNQITACAETRRNSAAQNTDSQISHNFETTFDVEGNIETRSTSSQGNKEDSRSQRSIGSGSKEGNRYFIYVKRITSFQANTDN